MTEAMLVTEKVERAALATLNFRINESQRDAQMSSGKTGLVRSLYSLAAANRGSGHYQMLVSLDHFALIEDHYEYPEHLPDVSPGPS